MHRHHHKKEFNVVAVTVMVFEVLGFSIFLFGIIGAVYNMFFDPPILTLWGFLIVVLGCTIIAFLMLAMAEFLQLLLKIEVNTRKTELLLEVDKPSAKKVVAKKPATRKTTRKKK